MAEVLCVGVAAHDFVFGLDAMPSRPEKYRAKTFASIGGGNSATAAAAVARLGGVARMAGRLGADEIGDLIVAGLEACGVDCALMRRFEGRRSSVSAVLVDAAGERTIVNYRDPDLPPSPEGILPDPLPASIGAVLADTRWTGGAVAAMARARAAGIPGVLDGEAPFADLDDALGLASHVAFSSQGLADLAGTRDIRRGLAAARDRVPGWLAVTNGAEGCFILDRDRLIRVPSIRVEAVDTLGAGDVWHGAFALRLAEGADAIDAVRFANVAAALKCTRFGGRAGVPDRAAVEAALAAHPLTPEIS